MTRFIPITLFIFVLLFIAACSDEPPPQKHVIARINNYTLSLEEFQRLLTAEFELDRDFKLTRKAQRAFLEDLIRKELLIQEAKRLELDKKEAFARAIERYWETTLIRTLMDMKGKDIIAKTYVSEEEIEAYYRHMKSTGEMQAPYTEVKAQIQQTLLEEKKSNRLKQWIDDLRQNASIEINDQLLGTGK